MCTEIFTFSVNKFEFNWDKLRPQKHQLIMESIICSINHLQMINLMKLILKLYRLKQISVKFLHYPHHSIIKLITWYFLCNYETHCSLLTIQFSCRIDLILVLIQMWDKTSWFKLCDNNNLILTVKNEGKGQQQITLCVFIIGITKFISNLVLNSIYPHPNMCCLLSFFHLSKVMLLMRLSFGPVENRLRENIKLIWTFRFSPCLILPVYKYIHMHVCAWWCIYYGIPFYFHILSDKFVQNFATNYVYVYESFNQMSMLYTLHN